MPTPKGMLLAAKAWISGPRSLVGRHHFWWTPKGGSSSRGPGDRALKLDPTGTIFGIRREAVPSGEILVRP